jgi:CBS domain-containing protein
MSQDPPETMAHDDGSIEPESRTDEVESIGIDEGAGPRIALREVFHRVNNVIPDSQQLQTVAPDTSSREALRIMSEKHFSQLPVVRSGEVLGSFSYRSFALRALNHHSRIALGDLPVEEFLEDLDLVHATAELASVYRALNRDDAILVGTPSDLQALLTPLDVLQYLNTLSEPFVQLGEIERSLRGVVRHSLDQEQIQLCAQRALKDLYTDRDDDIPTDVDDMTLGEIISVIRDGRNYELFAGLLGQHREMFTARFGQLSELRNVVLHFRRELLEGEREQIAEARDWLLRKLRGSRAAQ